MAGTAGPGYGPRLLGAQWDALCPRSRWLPRAVRCALSRAKQGQATTLAAVKEGGEGCRTLVGTGQAAGRWPGRTPPTSSARTLCGDSGATVSRGHRLPDLKAVMPSMGPIEKARPAVRTGGHRKEAPVAPKACRAHSQPSSPSHRFSSTRGSDPRWFWKAGAKGLRKHTPACCVTYRTRDTGRSGLGLSPEVALGVKTTGGHTATLTEHLLICLGWKGWLYPEIWRDFATAPHLQGVCSHLHPYPTSLLRHCCRSLSLYFSDSKTG